MSNARSTSLPRTVIHPEVERALSAGLPVVALESTIVSHGLPRPDNLRIARDIEQVVRDNGAVPATIAVVAGEVHVGLADDALSDIANRDDVIKVSVRDLGTLVARGGYGATTVAATAHIAVRSGIRVFATGGLGGVHRGARDTWDESADLTTLGAIPITVVCAGVKSILDVPATLERLETLNVAVIGLGTQRFPGFYLTDTGFEIDWSVDTEAEIAAVMAARDDLDLQTGVVIANPLPEAEQVDPALHERALRSGLAAADAAGIRGKEVTPFLLDWFHTNTDGESLRANIAIILSNARVAARIACARVESGAR